MNEENYNRLWEDWFTISAEPIQQFSWLEQVRDPNIVNMTLEIYEQNRSYTQYITVDKNNRLVLLLQLAKLQGTVNDFYVFHKGVKYENIDQVTFA